MLPEHTLRAPEAAACVAGVKLVGGNRGSSRSVIVDTASNVTIVDGTAHIKHEGINTFWGIQYAQHVQTPAWLPARRAGASNIVLRMNLEQTFKINPAPRALLGTDRLAGKITVISHAPRSNPDKCALWASLHPTSALSTILARGPASDWFEVPGMVRIPPSSPDKGPLWLIPTSIGLMVFDTGKFGSSFCVRGCARAATVSVPCVSLHNSGKTEWHILANAPLQNRDGEEVGALVALEAQLKHGGWMYGSGATPNLWRHESKHIAGLVGVAFARHYDTVVIVDSMGAGDGSLSGVMGLGASAGVRLLIRKRRFTNR